MGVPLTYTRPKLVAPRNTSSRSSRESLTESKYDGSVKSGNSGSSYSGIPDSLAFDKIVNGGTCPPMTVRDFMNYLIYIEHSAENLQFFLWYKDYVKRFITADTPDIGLSPEWTRSMEDDAVARVRKENTDKLRHEPAIAAELFRGTDFEKQAHHEAAGANPFSTPPRTPRAASDTDSTFTDSTALPSTTGSYKMQANDAFQTAGAKTPFTIQPFRNEIDRIIATYIMDGAPRQLNLASWEQKATLQALSHTTHPSALRLIITSVESTLRRQAHPNFIRWSICNGNPARVFFARALGVGLIIAGLAAGIVLTLSNAGRGYRALSAIGLVLGISTLVAAYKGMCVVLHGMHHRHVRPWELFVQSDDEMDTLSEGKRSFDSFGSANSYEEEPWVVRYEKRNVVRKVFDREVWIQEPALRQIQDTIFIQAILASVLLGGAIAAIFVAVPGGMLF